MADDVGLPLGLRSACRSTRAKQEQRASVSVPRLAGESHWLMTLIGFQECYLLMETDSILLDNDGTLFPCTTTSDSLDGYLAEEVDRCSSACHHENPKAPSRFCLLRHSNDGKLDCLR